MHSASNGIFNRVAIKDTKLKNITIREGDSVILSQAGLLYDEKIFPDHNTFKIDRFTKENEKNIPKYQYSPFGIGKRVCMGRYIAELSVKLFVLLFCRTFDVRQPAGVEYYQVYTVLCQNEKNLVEVRKPLRNFNSRESSTAAPGMSNVSH